MYANILSPSVMDGDSFHIPVNPSLLANIRSRLVKDLPISLALIRFDLAHFSNALYIDYGIPLSDEMKRAVEKRRGEFLAARVCARAVLKAIGIEGVPYQLPQQRQPSWPNHAVGSLTHSHHVAAAAVGLDSSVSGIGVDIEHWIDPQRAERLAASILTETELAHWTTFKQDKSRWLTRIFSAKESLYKLLNPITGIPFYFHDAQTDFSLTTDEIIALRLTHPLTSSYTENFLVYIHYLDTSDWVITLAVLRPNI